MLHRSPRRLQQESVLRIHHPDLARRHAEERRVESRYVIDESRTAGYDLAGYTWFGVEEFVDVPTVLGHLGRRVPAVAQYVPKLFGTLGTREARRVADDGKAGGLVRKLCRSHGRAFLLKLRSGNLLHGQIRF